jgi:Fe-S oxidoreductase
MMGLLKWVKGEKVLYYPGCVTKGTLKEELENYKAIFKSMGIDFVMLSEKEVCCGLPILNAGYRKDAKKLAAKNLKLFKEKKIDRIITNCPSCFHMFKEVYPKLIRDWDIPVEHATVVILKVLKRKGIKWKGREEDREIVGYHDPCYLGRYSGIYDEPREVVELLGGKVLESRFNREDALCCGAGGGVRDNFTELSEDIAKERVKSFDSDVKKIVSPCGLCHTNLKSASDKSVEFSSFVLGKLRGLRK